MADDAPGRRVLGDGAADVPPAILAADLRGRVEGQNNFSANSFPLSGARVELMDSTGRQVIASAYTGPDGLYYCRRIGPGR